MGIHYLIRNIRFLLEPYRRLHPSLEEKEKKIQQLLSPASRLILIPSKKRKTTYQVKALFCFLVIHVGSLLRLWKNNWIRFHLPLFRPRYEVGWIPDGRFSSVSVELNTVLFLASHRFRSLGTYIIFVYPCARWT